MPPSLKNATELLPTRVCVRSWAAETRGSVLRPCHPSPTSVSNLSELIVIGCAAPYLALNCGHLKVQKDVLDEACIMHSPCKCSAGQLRQWMGCGRLLLCRHSHSRCRRGPLCAPTRSQRRVSCFRLFLVTLEVFKHWSVVCSEPLLGGLKESWEWLVGTHIDFPHETTIAAEVACRKWPFSPISLFSADPEFRETIGCSWAKPG